MTGEPHSFVGDVVTAIQWPKPSHPKPSTEMATSTCIKKCPEPRNVVAASASPVARATVFTRHRAAK